MYCTLISGYFSVNFLAIVPGTMYTFGSAPTASSSFRFWKFNSALLSTGLPRTFRWWQQNFPSCRIHSVNISSRSPPSPPKYLVMWHSLGELIATAGLLVALLKDTLPPYNISIVLTPRVSPILYIRMHLLCLWRHVGLRTMGVCTIWLCYRPLSVVIFLNSPHLPSASVYAVRPHIGMETCSLRPLFSVSMVSMSSYPAKYSQHWHGW